MSIQNKDLGLLLESDLLQLIRTQGIFLVLGLALFNFTKRGKWFSVIFLTISLILNIILLVNFYIDRQTALLKGFKIKTLLDVLAIIMVFVAIFNIWIIYETYHTESTWHLSEIALDIHKKIQLTKQNNIENTENNTENNTIYDKITPVIKHNINKPNIGGIVTTF